MEWQKGGGTPHSDSMLNSGTGNGNQKEQGAAEVSNF